jgi:hypothetical protein
MSDPSDSPPIPDWAMNRARVELNMGMKVPEIQQLLVDRGLSRAEAEEAVISVVENRVGQRIDSVQRTQRSVLIHRILSGALGNVCIVLAYLLGGAQSAIKALGAILLPLFCIWFSERARLSTPGLVRFAGWLLLIAICLYWLVWIGDALGHL